MMNFKSLSFFKVASAAFFFACTPAVAQWQVPDNAVAIGRGSPNIGFKNVPLPSGSLLIGQSGIPLAVIPTGDVTITTGGVTAIGATKVTSAMLNSNVYSTAHTWSGQQTFVAPILGTPASGVATNLTGTAAGLTAGNVTTNANLTGDVTSVGNATTLTNAPVIAKVLTGFTSGAGTVTAADSILTAIQKVYGNDALKAPLASPALTGVPTAPTASPGTNTTQISTTAFVQAAVAASTTGVSAFNGRTGAVAPTSGDYTSAQVNTTSPLTGGTLRTQLAKNSDVVSILDFGADNTGATDTVAAFNSACAAGRQVYFPPGTYLAASAYNLNVSAGVACSIIGAGYGVTSIKRAVAFTAGNLINIVTSGAPTAISDIKIVNANGTTCNTGTGIHIGTATDITLNNVYVLNGYNLILADGNPSARIMMGQLWLVQDSSYVVSCDTINGLAFIGAHHYDVYGDKIAIISGGAGLTHSMQRGLYITSSDGMEFSKLGIGAVNSGIVVAGGSGNAINNVYVDNSVVDNVRTPLVITGNNTPLTYSNLRFSNSHFNGQNTAGSGDGVSIGGDADYVQLIGSNVNLAYGSGVVIGAGNSWAGVAKKSIQVANNQISANNLSATAGLGGITIANNATGFQVTGNTMTNRSGVGSQFYGTIIGSNASDFMLTGNKNNGNITGGCTGGAGATNFVTTGNLGSGC